MDEKNEYTSTEDDTVKEINLYKSKLKADRKKYMDLEVNMFRIKLLKSKAMFVRDNVNKESAQLDEQLERIHMNYMKTAKQATRALDLEMAIRAKIGKLTTQRDQLKKEYVVLQKSAKDNANKLKEVNMMIMEQEKKNAALLRRLKKRSEDSSIPGEIRVKIDEILNNIDIKKEKVYETTTLFYPI